MEVKSTPADLPSNNDVTVPTSATPEVQSIATKVKPAVEKQMSRKFGTFQAYKYIKKQYKYLIRVDVGGEYIDVMTEYRFNKATLKGTPATGRGPSDPMSL